MPILMPTGATFVNAMADHFGLPKDQVESVEVHTERDEPFAVTLRLRLSGADLRAIGERMAFVEQPNRPQD